MPLLSGLLELSGLRVRVESAAQAFLLLPTMPLQSGAGAVQPASRVRRVRQALKVVRVVMAVRLLMFADRFTATDMQ